MKALLLLALGFTPAAAFAAGDRHIPRGELSPQIIEKAFGSPIGEVEFTSVGSGGHSAMLRNVRGRLMGFTEVRGSQACEQWFLSDKSREMPRNCQFLFFDENSGRTLEVRGDELEESSLFTLASSAAQVHLCYRLGGCDRRGRPDVAL
jgi:hypothetical protein